MNLLRRSTTVVTVLHAALSAVAVFVEGTVRGVIGVVFVAAFGIGLVVFMAAFVIAANRSRREHVSVVGAFFLSDGAVDVVDRRLMLGAVFAQTAVAIVAASMRPVTAVAFTVLVPLLGLSLAAQFGARFGRFDPREMA